MVSCSVVLLPVHPSSAPQAAAPLLCYLLPQRCCSPALDKLAASEPAASTISAYPVYTMSCITRRSLTSPCGLPWPIRPRNGKWGLRRRPGTTGQGPRAGPTGTDGTAPGCPAPGTDIASFDAQSAWDAGLVRRSRLRLGALDPPVPRSMLGGGRLALSLEDGVRPADPRLATRHGVDVSGANRRGGFR